MSDVNHTIVVLRKFAARGSTAKEFNYVPLSVLWAQFAVSKHAAYCVESGMMMHPSLAKSELVDNISCVSSGLPPIISRSSNNG